VYKKSHKIKIIIEEIVLKTVAFIAGKSVNQAAKKSDKIEQKSNETEGDLHLVQ
jgi:hypothetical protein